MKHRQRLCLQRILILFGLFAVIGGLSACNLVIGSSTSGSTLAEPGSASTGSVTARTTLAAGTPTGTALHAPGTGSTTAASAAVPSLDLGAIRWTQEMRDFFGASAEAKLAQAAPLLIAASQTSCYQAVDFTAADKPMDAQFAWMLVYLLVNNQSRSDNTIKAGADGSLTIPADRLRDYFQSSIQGFAGDIPAIPADYAKAISLDSISKTYRLSRAADDALQMKIRKVSIDRRVPSAIIGLEMAAPNGEILAACLVTIQSGSGTAFGYRVRSIIQDESLPQTVAFGTYANTKLGYAIAYPLLFKSIAESANGDGATFLSDSTVQLAIWGQFITNGQTIRTIADAARLENPDYTVFICESDHYGLSYPGDQDTCLYAYGRLIDDILIQFVIQYPANESTTYDALIQDMVTSLKKR